MQETKKSKSNRLRSEASRALLIEKSRDLFAEKGYSETGTPELVSAIGLSRGVLYHHFADKLALFRAVIENEAKEVADHIAHRAPSNTSGIETLLQGTEAYFEAMRIKGRARLLLIEGPAVLGVQTMDEIDQGTGRAELALGLKELLSTRQQKNLSIDALASILSASFDKAALAISMGESEAIYIDAIRYLLMGISDEVEK